MSTQRARNRKKIARSKLGGIRCKGWCINKFRLADHLLQSLSPGASWFNSFRHRVNGSSAVPLCSECINRLRNQTRPSWVKFKDAWRELTLEEYEVSMVMDE